MDRHAASPDPSTISRREALRRAALVLGVAVSPAWLACADRARQVAAPTYLTLEQFALVGAVAGRVIPRTDTPGAVEVGVPAFLDLLYGEYLSDEERARFIAGLDAIAAASASAHGTAFPDLDAADGDAVLRAVAEAEQGRADSGFRQVRTSVIVGYFTSEEVGRNVLHYDPIPGRFDACVPIDEVGNVTWTT